MTDIILQRGITFRRTYRWSDPAISYRQVLSIARGVPTVITSPAHGIPNGWMVAITNVKGMKQVNTGPSVGTPDLTTDYLPITVIDANRFSIDVNSTDFGNYVSGGVIHFETPVDMTGFTASAPILAPDAAYGDTPLLDNVSGGTITINVVGNEVVWQIPGATIASQLWTAGKFVFYMTSSGGVVTELDAGQVSIR